MADSTCSTSSGSTGVASLTPFAVVEDVDVLADAAVLVEDPARDRRVDALERAQRVADRRAVHLDLGRAAGEIAKGRAQPHDGHAEV